MRPGEPTAGVYVTSFGAVVPRRHGAHDDRTKVLASRAHGLQSRCRCGRGEPSPGADVGGGSSDADVGGVSPIPAQMWRAHGQRNGETQQGMPRCCATDASMVRGCDRPGPKTHGRLGFSILGLREPSQNPCCSLPPSPNAGRGPTAAGSMRVRSASGERRLRASVCLRARWPGRFRAVAFVGLFLRLVGVCVGISLELSVRGGEHRFVPPSPLSST